MCENLDRFRDLKERNPNIVLQICTTTNVFNVRYLDQVAQWIDRNHESFNMIYWNIMHDAWYFSVATLPDPAKAAITAYLQSADIPARYRADIDGIIDFMNRGASTDGNMLRMKIRDLDRKRNQNLADVEPEFAALINYNYNDPDPNIPQWAT